MRNYIFGKDIQRTFYPLENDEPVNLVSQIPSIYLYSSQPSLADAAVGTGASKTVSYWTHSSTPPYPRTYSFTAVEDPDPTGGTTCRGYWEVVNYIVQNGGTKNTKLRYFELERGAALEDTPGTTIDDIKAIWPGVSNYLSDTELNAHLAIAEAELRQDLKANNINWSQCDGLSALKYALAYKAIVFNTTSQMVRGGAIEKFRELRDFFMAAYNAAISQIKLGYDADKDGAHEDEPTGQNNYAIINR